MRIVIPSLQYADYLVTSLPVWRSMFPSAEIRVVTGAMDHDSIRVGGQYDVDVIVSDAWHRDGAVFNKAAALDEALGHPPIGTLCLVADADVVPFGMFPLDDQLARDVLYGCGRYFCPDLETLEAHRAGLLPRDQLALILPRRSGEPDVQLLERPTIYDVRQLARKALGYCQVFRYRPGLQFGSSHNAAGYDNRFARQFSLRGPLPDSFYVLHLGGQDRANWNGRVLPPWKVA